MKKVALRRHFVVKGSSPLLTLMKLQGHAQAVRQIHTKIPNHTVTPAARHRPRVVLVKSCQPIPQRQHEHAEAALQIHFKLLPSIVTQRAPRNRSVPKVNRFRQTPKKLPERALPAQQTRTVRRLTSIVTLPAPTRNQLAKKVN